MRLPLTAIIVIILVTTFGCSDDPTNVRTSLKPLPDPTPFIATTGSTGYDEAHDIAVDPSGNVFVLGAVGAPVDFGGDTFDPADGPVFLAKYDPTGAFEWVLHISGAGADGPLYLGTDTSGDVIVYGILLTSLTINGVTVSASGGADHVFVARLGGTGNVKWISHDSGPFLSVGFGMGTGPSGDTAVTGFIKAGATFGDTELSVQGFDFFLVRYDAQGNASWAKQTGSNTAATGDQVAVDPQGNVIVAGSFDGSFALDGVEVTATGGDAFIARYNAAGELQWLKSLGDDVAEDIHAIATDGDGDIYVSGRRATSMLWKLSSDGAVIWEGPGPPASDIAPDSQENIFLAGEFLGTLTVGETEVTSNGFTDFFIARYDPQGNGAWVVSGGASKGDRVQGLAVDANDAPLAVVDFAESFEFRGETITSHGNQDILFMRLE